MFESAFFFLMVNSVQGGKEVKIRYCPPFRKAFLFSLFLAMTAKRGECHVLLYAVFFFFPRLCEQCFFLFFFFSERRILEVPSFFPFFPKSNRFFSERQQE